MEESTKKYNCYGGKMMEEGLIRNYLDNVVAHLDTEGRDDVDILVTKYN